MRNLHFMFIYIPSFPMGYWAAFKVCSLKALPVSLECISSVLGALFGERNEYLSRNVLNSEISQIATSAPGLSISP